MGLAQSFVMALPPYTMPPDVEKYEEMEFMAVVKSFPLTFFF